MPVTILIVEDNEDVREDLRFLLQAEKFRVVEAADAVSGIEAAQKERPSLIICDIGLADGPDGFAVLDAVRSGPAPATPFLFLTARGSPADMRRAIQTGANDYLTKPYTGPELLSAVRTALSRAQDRPAEVHANVPGMAEATAVLMLRVDRFHYMENLLGSDERQALIVRIEERVRNFEGVSINRVDLNEFLLILPPQSVDKVMALCKEILSALRQPVQVGERYLNLAVNAGLCTDENLVLDGDERVRRAEIALQHALDRGAQLVSFRDELRSGALSELDIENSLLYALTRKEFQVWFQPQFRTADLALCGREALIRWQHPQHGMISPARFIPVAEASGLIRDIDKWMLSESCKILIENGAPGWLSVNLSARDIEDRRLVESVAAVLEQTGLPADRLDLEITESCIMRNPDEALHRLHALRALGVSLSVDDFGTGYSSLAYLKNLPIDRVKIDRSFVTDLDRNDSSRHIIRTIVDLAANLKIEIVAEGVETAEQLEIIRGLGVQIVQGYFTGRPAPAVVSGPQSLQSYAP